MTQIPGLSNSDITVKRQFRLLQKLSTIMAIFIFNLALFLVLGSYVVYRVIVTERQEPLFFVKTKPPPPPQKPPAKGGEAAKSLADPNTLIVPPTAPPPSTIVSSLPSSISFSPVISSAPETLSLPILVPSGAGLSSGTTGDKHPMVNPFGDNTVAGVPGLVGELYDLKQNPSGTPTTIAIVPPETVDSMYPNWGSLPATQEGLRVLRSYVRGWDQNILDQYYKAAITLNASQIFIPLRTSEEATKAFKVDDKVTARRWIVHYHGTILPPKSGRFRFLGFGDDFLVVRIGSQNVLDGSFPGEKLDENANQPDEGIPGPDGHSLSVGKWVDFESGIPTSIDVLIGEGPGGFSGFVLLIEEEGDTSAKGDYPVFQVTETAVPQINNYPAVFTGKTMLFPAQ